MNIIPLGDRVIIRPSEAKSETASGIILAPSAVEKPNQGEIVAIGNGRYNEQKGETVPLSVQPGDNVLYGKYGGTEIQYEGETLLIMRESDLFAKI